MRNENEPTAAQVRGAIQAGETGDIREGFDPAAAPMETDGEAAGSPMSPEQAQIALDTQRRPGRQEDQHNYDTAMRKPASLDTKAQGGTSPGFILRLVGLFLVGAAVIVTLVLVAT
ncbi:hypothetical protein [Rhizobium sp. CC-YZS058]|uniref:hypothetical protein n=1 Tax=Rhizobium sp. CC-YZS058 TaxID=3042153 RepID=UPI002B05DE71|nr:hypothetical protein [Rhizobium sp. CC-YZS058]MEA3533202.1 hypothetical protein [Rhizobium sp. CC-YZS058]